MANMDLDSDSEEQEADVPIFTAELARLKAKETGGDVDEDMDAEPAQAVDSEDGE